MRGWDWTKKTASDIQAKVLLPLSRHTLGHTQINYIFKKNQVEKKYPNLRKDAEKAAVAFVSKFEEVMLKIWSSLIHAGKVSAKFAIDVKE